MDFSVESHLAKDVSQDLLVHVVAEIAAKRAVIVCWRRISRLMDGLNGKEREKEHRLGSQIASVGSSHVSPALDMTNRDGAGAAGVAGSEAGLGAETLDRGAEAAIEIELGTIRGTIRGAEEEEEEEEEEALGCFCLFRRASR